LLRVLFHFPVSGKFFVRRVGERKGESCSELESAEREGNAFVLSRTEEESERDGRFRKGK
jgi:hypothetical protein